MAEAAQEVVISFPQDLAKYNSDAKQPSAPPSRIRIMLFRPFFNPDSETFEQPFYRAWRKALAKAPPIPHIVFDLTMPELDKKRGRHTQKWRFENREHTEPFQVDIDSVCRLLFTIATLASMRMEGRALQFDVVVAELTPAMETLQDRLDNIAKGCKESSEA